MLCVLEQPGKCCCALNLPQQILLKLLPVRYQTQTCGQPEEWWMCEACMQHQQPFKATFHSRYLPTNLFSFLGLIVPRGFDSAELRAK